MYLLIIFLPLLSFFISSLLGRFFGRYISIYLCLLCSLITVFSSLYIFYEIFLMNSIVNIKLYNFITLDYFSLFIGFFFDSLTSSMLLIITLISFFVHVYSVGYMSHDPHINRFISYLSLFTFFMLILVTADNFLQLFVG
jgi:NADH:ubiquinone oxidoreductase subunit 5 (subunit L)/multisubunit Na+/H+ antiporter MnhA subunit